MRKPTFYICEKQKSNSAAHQCRLISSFRCINIAISLVSLSEISKLSLVVRKPAFAYAKTKTQISCAVTAQLISAFVFATLIEQPLHFLNPKFRASSHLLLLYSRFVSDLASLFLTWSLTLKTCCLPIRHKTNFVKMHILGRCNLNRGYENTSKFI